MTGTRPSAALQAPADTRRIGRIRSETISTAAIFVLTIILILASRFVSPALGSWDQVDTIITLASFLIVVAFGQGLVILVGGLDLSIPFYGYNRPGAKVSEGVRDSFWLQGMMCGFKTALDYIKAFSETDFTEDLRKIDVPTLVVHGDDDQIVPIAASALKTAKLVKGATLKVYPGAPHGIATTHADKFNADLLAFIKG